MNNFLECEAYLVKPIDEEQLLGLLQNYLHLDWIENQVSLA